MCDSNTGLEEPRPKNGTVLKGRSYKLMRHLGFVLIVPINKSEFVSTLHPPAPTWNPPVGN